MATEHEAEIEAAICEYLRANPDTRDTFEGVVKWWLLKQRIDQSASEVQNALKVLIERRVLKVVQCAGGRTYYCAATARRTDCEADDALEPE